MRLLRPQLLAFVSAFVLSGCGTVANFSTMKPEVYGGVAVDLAFLESGTSLGITDLGAHNESPWVLAALLGLIPAELCCTFLADTATLPLTMVLDDDWHLHKDKPVPERTEVPIAFGVNGPYLWEAASEGPNAP